MTLLSHSELIPQLKSFISNLLLTCGEMAINYRKQGITFELKKDGTKVTKADIEIQKFIISNLVDSYSDFRITAEEILEGEFSASNLSNENSDYRWIIDPIDGTSMFVQPDQNYFGHAIALMYKNSPIFSAFYSPEYTLDAFDSNDYPGTMFLADCFTDGILVNNIVRNISNISLDDSPRKVNLDNVNLDELNTGNFLVEKKSRSATLTLALIASGLEISPVILGNGDAAIWDVIPGTYLVERSGGISLFKDLSALYPLVSSREIYKMKGEVSRPIISGEYFSGYKSAIHKLLRM